MFKIDGVSMPAPDQDVVCSYEDIDASWAGRDEAGVMHRVPVRHKVGTWSFSYGYLTTQQLYEIEALFEGKTTFVFTHPGKDGPEDTVCYRSKYAVSFRNAKTGLWRGYGFTIIAC